MKRLVSTIALLALACNDGGGPTGPNSPSIAGTYFVNATTITNTCGPGLDQELLEIIDESFVEVRRDGNSYTVGFDTFILAVVNGNNLHATQTLTFSEGTGVVTFDWDFSSSGQSFDGTIEVVINVITGESCTLSFLTHGERD
jgi:hypothetical protein